MSNLTIATLENIHPDTFSPEEKYALDILENLPVAESDHLKNLMDLNTQSAINLTTVRTLVEFAHKYGFDLSEAGINAFKDAHKLGNTGAVRGVIGPQTAQIYYNAFIDKITPKPVQDEVRQINEAGLHLIEEFEGLARQLPDGKIAAYRDAVGVPTIGYGHTHGVYLGMVITREEAEAFLKEDLRQAETAVSNW